MAPRSVAPQRFARRGGLAFIASRGPIIEEVIEEGELVPYRPYRPPFRLFRPRPKLRPKVAAKKMPKSTKSRTGAPIFFENPERPPGMPAMMPMPFPTMRPMPEVSPTGATSSTWMPAAHVPTATEAAEAATAGAAVAAAAAAGPAAGAAAAAAGPDHWTQKFREDIKASCLVGYSSEEEDGKAECEDEERTPLYDAETPLGKAECEEERDEEEGEVDWECTTPLYDAETLLSLGEYPELDEDALGLEGTMLDEDALGGMLHAMDADGDGAARRRRRISSKRQPEDFPLP